MVERLCGADDIVVLQHGIEHRNHAREGQRKIELGGQASAAELAIGLVAGRETLATAFGSRYLPVLVPPWNRMDQAVADGLAGRGFVGLSGWRGGSFATPAGMRRLDTHLDAIRWRPKHQCLSLAELLDGLAAALRVEPLRAVGLLTHHLVTDDGGWRALDRFLGLVQDHPKLAFASAPSLLMEAS